MYNSYAVQYQHNTHKVRWGISDATKVCILQKMVGCAAELYDR